MCKPTFNNTKLNNMIGLAAVTAMGVAALIVRKFEKASEYKRPKGKHKNRYK